jgi:hypothetical protein
MKFFKNCQTIEEVKTTFKKLALQHHPDRGGCTQTMQEINSEYSFAIANIAKGTQFQNEEIKIAEDFQSIIEQLINLEGLIIDIVGNWLWVHGDTKPFKEAIKKAGLFWANKKKMWYYRPANAKGGNGKKTYAEITQKYGRQTVNTFSRNLKLS